MACERTEKLGVFEADLRAGEIRKLPLQDKRTRILSALLRNPGTVVSRDELRRGVAGRYLC